MWRDKAVHLECQRMAGGVGGDSLRRRPNSAIEVKKLTFSPVVSPRPASSCLPAGPADAAAALPASHPGQHDHGKWESVNSVNTVIENPNSVANSTNTPRR